MKEIRESPMKGSHSSLEPGGRMHPNRMSVSSHRSERSNASQESHKTQKLRKKSRPRGLSFSSLHSQAVSDHSSSSVGSNNLSRKTSHADDSDASDTNESLGETEEDVWFPTDARNYGDINVDELDQLLNLSDEEKFDPNVRPFRVPGFSNQEGGTPASAVNADKGFGRRNEDATHHRTEARDDNRAVPGSALSPETSQLNMGLPFGELELNGEPVHNVTGGARRKFVEYRHRQDDRFDMANSPSSSSGSGSVQKQPEVFKSDVDTADDDTEKDPNVHGPDTGNDQPFAEMEPIRKRVSHPPPALGEETPPVIVDDQQSQRYSFFAAGLENTIHAPDLASLVGESDSFSSLFTPENGAWFLDCFRPTDVEMKALSRAFGIHPLTTEDIQTEDAREKYESFKNYYLVVYHTFESDKDDPEYMRAINFYMLVFKEGVISFHFEPVSHCRNVRRRMRQLRDYLAFTPDWIAYALIDDITDSFAPEIQSVEKEADFVEDAVYLDSNGSTDMSTLLRRLGEGRRHTMHLLRMLSGKADVVRGFAKRVNERNMSSEMTLYLGDIQDHIVTMYQNLSAYEKIFSRTHFNYMGLLQMEFVDSSNRMTGVLGKVTILGTVLVPMNLITGLFGMNVHVPGQSVENLRWFFGILGLVLFLIITLLLGSALYVKFTMKTNTRRESSWQHS